MGYKAITAGLINEEELEDVQNDCLSNIDTLLKLAELIEEMKGKENHREVTASFLD